MRAVAHDINHWLTIIRSQCELGRRDANRGDVASMLDRFLKIDAGVDSCSKIITAFFSRPVQAKLPGQFDLNNVARKVAFEVADELDKTGIALDLELATPALVIAGDALSMECALLNLCINARDAVRARHGTPTSGAGVGNVKIVTRPAKAEQKAAVLEISDNGIGMQPDVAWRQTFDNGPASGEHGHGLRTVRKTVAQLRGWMDVKTAPDKGTTFSIFLPMRDLQPRKPGSSGTRSP